MGEGPLEPQKSQDAEFGSLLDEVTARTEIAVGLEVLAKPCLKTECSPCLKINSGLSRAPCLLFKTLHRCESVIWA